MSIAVFMQNYIYIRIKLLPLRCNEHVITLAIIFQSYIRDQHRAVQLNTLKGPRTTLIHEAIHLGLPCPINSPKMYLIAYVEYHSRNL